MDNKLNIEEIRYLIPDYITGTLDDNNKRMVETALNESQELTDFYNEMKGTFDFVNTVKFEEPPQQYWNNLLPRIHQRIEERAEKKTAKNPLSFLWKILVPVAAVVLIFIIYQLAFSPEKQIADKEKHIKIEKEEPKDSNIDKNQIKENSTADESSDIKDDNSSENDNNSQKPVIRTYKEEYDDNYETTAENTNSQNDNEIKENVLNSKDKEEIAVVDVDETAILNASQGAGFDEEIEKDLNKLDDKDQKNLLEELSNSNL